MIVLLDQSWNFSLRIVSDFLFPKKVWRYNNGLLQIIVKSSILRNVYVPINYLAFSANSLKYEFIGALIANVPEFKRGFRTIGPRACDLFDASLARLSFAVFPAATLSVSTINSIGGCQTGSPTRLFSLELASLPLYVFGSNRRNQVP